MRADASEEEVAKALEDWILEALRSAWKFLPPQDMSEQVKRLSSQLDIDWRELRMTTLSGFGYTSKNEICWGVDYEVIVRIEPSIQMGDRALKLDAWCEIGWSGSSHRDPTKAIAAASHHMEGALAAAKATTAMQAALDRFSRIPGDTIGAAWKTVYRGLNERFELQSKRIHAAALEEETEHHDAAPAPAEESA